MLTFRAFQSLLLAAAVIVMFGSSTEAAPTKTTCIKCFVPPRCPPCEAGYTCQITPATCNDCGSGGCVKIEAETCYQCFAPPSCPPCSAGYKCQITPATCNSCGSGKCIKA